MRAWGLRWSAAQRRRAWRGAGKAWPASGAELDVETTLVAALARAPRLRSDVGGHVRSVMALD